MLSTLIGLVVEFVGPTGLNTIVQYTLGAPQLTKLLYNATRTIHLKEQKAVSTPRPLNKEIKEKELL